MKRNTLWTVNWDPEDVPDGLTAEDWGEWTERFQENRKLLADLPEKCVRAQKAKLLEWMKEQKVQISEGLQQLQRLYHALPAQRSLKRTWQKAHDLAERNFQRAAYQLNQFLEAR
jgi:hypothetical protein